MKQDKVIIWEVRGSISLPCLPPPLKCEKLKFKAPDKDSLEWDKWQIQNIKGIAFSKVLVMVGGAEISSTCGGVSLSRRKRTSPQVTVYECS